MKKQFLLLAIFTLAVFAGTNTAYGQLLPGVTGGATPNPIDPLSCITGSLPLHPFPGISYTYTMNNGTSAETSANYTWWATKDANFISGPGGPATVGATNIAGRLTVSAGQLIAAGTNYATTTPIATPGANSIQITWSPEILSGTTYQGDGVAPNGTPTFVVGYSEGINCADNIQVFEINPQKNFTLDIASIDTADAASPTEDWGVPTEQCVDDVQSATYNTTSHELDMDYGKNNFYFEVAAANFVTNWNPVFTIISGLENNQEAIIRIYDSYADALAGTGELGNSGVLTDANLGVGNGWDPDIDLTAVNPADATTGVSLFVRVTIYNNTWESLDINPFELAIDAEDASGTWDMEDADCNTATADNSADQLDTAIHNINPRPTLQMDGGAMGEPSTVAPEDVIEKTEP